jgi:hypothetical protein
MFKGVKLQVCELLRRINGLGNETEILQLIQQLIKVDPLRQGYYHYLGEIITFNYYKQSFFLSSF